MNQELQDLFDTAVFTTKFVMEDKKTITYVSHEIEDGAWQFFSDDKFDDFESVAKVVGLREIIKLDPSIIELIDMQEGFIATRHDKQNNWDVKRMD
jgi:hypothetical protein